ncbi:hypothetical protein ACOMHN_045730 [Nucella lapillus]
MTGPCRSALRDESHSPLASLHSYRVLQRKPGLTPQFWSAAEKTRPHSTVIECCRENQASLHSYRVMQRKPGLAPQL